MSLTKNYTAGFTLIEMLSVIAVLMVMGGLFYNTFVLNWQGMDNNLTETQLWTEADAIAEDMTYYGRGGKQILVPDAYDVTIAYPDPSQNISYSITNTPSGGLLTRTTGNTVLSYHVNYAGSSFALDNLDSLVVTLELQDTPLFGSSQVSTQFRVLPREPTGVQGA